jgi:eukaryotic-like serine/threonine-protein kinase
MLDWRPGILLENRYEIRNTLGGGFGEVHIVYDHALQRLMAMKTLRREYLADASAVQRFFQEANMMVETKSHRHFVTAYFAKMVAGKLCLFMEYVEGGSLRRRIGRLDLRSVLSIATQFCDGMTYLHDFVGIIHGDIKPENILISREGIVKITDFGLASYFWPRRMAHWVTGTDHDSGPDTPIMGGTYPYMPPEQWTGVNVGRWSDVYAFGVVLYEMLASRLPFLGRSGAEWAQLHAYAIPARLSTVQPAIPADLDLLVARCLEKDPSRRPPDFSSIDDVLLRMCTRSTGR